MNSNVDSEKENGVLSPKSWVALQNVIAIATQQQRNEKINDELNWNGIQNVARQTFKEQGVKISEQTLSDSIAQAKKNPEERWGLSKGNEKDYEKIEHLFNALKSMNISTPKSAFEVYLKYQWKWYREREKENVWSVDLIFNRTTLIMTVSFGLLTLFVPYIGISGLVGTFVGTFISALSFAVKDRKKHRELINEVHKELMCDGLRSRKFAGMLQLSLLMDLFEDEDSLVVKARYPCDAYRRIKWHEYAKENESVEPQFFIDTLIKLPNIPPYYQQQLAIVLRGWIHQEGHLHDVHYTMMMKLSELLQGMFEKEKQNQAYIEKKQEALNEINKLIN